ncbi:hypothetical protein Tco_1142262 [Tanacetum coccineum]
MADLKFVDQHNMIACLEKSEENTDFHQIVDFLSTCSINYALTVSPTIYASYIEQFWNTATSKIVNFVKQIHAKVDGRAVVISESSVRNDLLFDDEDGITCITNDEIFENLALMEYEQLSTKLTFRKGGPIPDRAEGDLNLEELFALCTNLSNRVLALETAKDAQAAEILHLKAKIKKLEKKCKPSISHHRAWLKSMRQLSMKRRLGKKESVSKQGRKNAKPDLNAFDDLDTDLTHGMEYIETEETVSEGRQSKETEELNVTHDTEVLEKGGSNEEQVNTASTPVSTAGVTISTAAPEVSAVEPRTPPTKTSIFDDEDINMAQTLIKMKEEKAKEKGVAFKEVKETDRPARLVLTLKPLPSIDPKDKGKGILVEEEPVKIKSRDQGIAQIESGANLAKRLYEEDMAEIERVQKEKAAQEEASRVAIMKMFDEVQVGINADALFAAKL